MAYLWVAAGGALGAMARFGVVSLTSRLVEHSFFYGTLLANLLGSFAIGMLYIWLVEHQLDSSWHRPMLMVGFLGAFTTFSTFSLDTLALWQNGHLALGAAYVALNIVLCLAGTLGAIVVTRLL